MTIDYIKLSLANIIGKAENTDNPLLEDLIALYDEIDSEGGSLLDE